MKSNQNHLRKIGTTALAIAALSLSGLESKAQFLQDAIRVAQPDYGSTARFKALGNAQTSLGGDLSSIGGNPAGLGFFNQSDIGLSFDFLSDVNDANYFDSNSNNSLNKLGLSQAAVVFNFPTVRARGSNLQDGWLNFNVGIGYHKTNDFNSTLGYSGINPSSTFAHFLADKRDSPFGEIEGDFGWESYLVDFNESSPNNTYHYPTVLEGDNAQKNILTDRGQQSTTNISFGSNYSNKLYLGFSLGLSSFRYDTNQLFSESGYTKSFYDIQIENPYSEFLDSNSDAYQFLEAEYDLEYSYKQKTQGTGVNATLGVIYKPAPNVNIGLSATTPTWYHVSDEAFTFMDTWYYDNASATEPFFTYNSDQIENYLEYNLRTPYRVSGGVSTVFGMGLVSVDLEYVDYSSMRFSASDALSQNQKIDLDNEMNQGIKDTYTSAMNVRAGAEYMFAQNLLGRIGYSHKGSPYKDSDFKTQTISGGLGYRINNLYIDLTYQNFQQSFSSSPYTIDTDFWKEAENPSADIKNMRHNVYLTLGFKF